jgi:CRP/FNR family cyclic AMP-dependent transcriptional regulator
MKTEDALRGVELFASLNPRQIARLTRLAHTREFALGTRILRRGDPATALYIVLRGQVSVTHPSGEMGSEWALGQIGPGEAFGEMALIDGGPRSADITAAQPTECLMLSRLDFAEELRRDPNLARALLPVLCAKIRRLQEQLSRYELHGKQIAARAQEVAEQE